MDMSFIFWGTFGLFSFFWLIQIEFLWTYTGFCVNISFHFSRRNSQSVQFSHSVVSNTLRPHGLQHARSPCLSPNPRVYASSWPLSQWCHPTISPSVVPFSSHLQSFPASGSFQMSQFFPSGGQNIGVSLSASVLPMNIQDWFPLGWADWISLQSKDSQESSPTPQFKSTSSSALSFLYSPILTSTWLLEKQ